MLPCMPYTTYPSLHFLFLQRACVYDAVALQRALQISTLIESCLNIEAQGKDLFFKTSNKKLQIKTVPCT